MADSIPTTLLWVTGSLATVEGKAVSKVSEVVKGLFKFFMIYLQESMC